MAEHVGPGWKALVDQLEHDLRELVPNFEVEQVKEKFAGLRVYAAVPPGTDPAVLEQFFNRIYRAEAESLKICEQCGEPGYVSNEAYWMKTMCQRHHLARRYGAGLSRST